MIWRSTGPLAATGASHDDHGIAFIDRKTNAVEDGAVSELAHQIANLNDRIFVHLSPEPNVLRRLPVASWSTR